MRNAALACLLLLVACAGSTPQRSQYLLRAEEPPGTRRVDAPVSVVLDRVAVAAYLDRRGLVMETADHQVREARHHQWAEPLDRGLRRLLRAELSKALGYPVSAEAGQRAAWDYTVDVQIDQLHGTAAGRARLVAGFRIAPATAGGEPAAFRFSRETPLAREGYAALVDAEIALARQLAADIAEALRTLGAP
jgi:uncharacterized lipoprotein YmbA